MVFYLKKIELKNFKAHKNLVIEFSKGKNIIIGENGVGKSSIFHAIIFSLFGNVSKSYIGFSEVSNLVRHLCAEARVKLELTNEKETFSIEREIRRGYSGNARITKGSSIITSGVDVTNKKILDLMSIRRPEKYLDVLYIPQGKLGEFVEYSGRKELTEKLEEIFDIKLYSKMIDVLKKLINEMDSLYYEKKKELFEKERELRKIEEMYEGKSLEELEQLLKEKRNIEKELKKLILLKSEINTLKSSIDYSLLSKKEEFLNKLDKIEKELELLETKLNELYSEKSNYKYDPGLILKEKNLDDLERLRENLSKKVEGLNKMELEYEKEKLLKIVKDIEEFESLSGVENKMQEILEELEKLKEFRIKTKEKIKTIEESINLLSKETEGVCPVCGKQLSKEEAEKIIKQKEIEVKNLLEELKKTEEKVKSLEIELKNVEKNYKRYEYLKEKLVGENIDINKLKNEKDKLLDCIRQINEKIEELEFFDKVVNTINYIKWTELDRVIKDLERRIKEIKGEERNIIIVVNKIKIMETNLKRINELLSENGFSNEEEIDDEITKLEKRLSEIGDISEREVYILKKYLEDVNKLRIKVKDIKEKLDILTKARSILERFVREYRSRFAEALSNNLSLWFKRLYKYEDLLDAKVDVSKTPFGYRFIIKVLKNVDGKHIWMSVSEAGLSGGQKKVLDLAMRFALADLVKLNLKVLLLDEPTESLDENVRINLAEILENLKEYQIILCTHDELFKEKMSGNVIELKRS